MRRELEAAGIRPVLVHPDPEARAAEVLPAYALQDLPRVSDPGLDLFRAFGLIRGGWRSFVNLRVVFKGAWSILKHGAGLPQGDARQLGGAVLLEGGRVVRTHVNRSIADDADVRRFALG